MSDGLLPDVNVPDRHNSRFLFSSYNSELSQSVLSLTLVQLGSDFTSFMKDLTSLLRLQDISLLTEI